MASRFSCTPSLEAWYGESGGAFGEQMPDQASLGKYHQNCLNLVFQSAFMPVAQDGPMYCIWEAKELRKLNSRIY